jgi:hypothetical protein
MLPVFHFDRRNILWRNSACAQKVRSSSVEREDRCDRCPRQREPQRLVDPTVQVKRKLCGCIAWDRRLPRERGWVRANVPQPRLRGSPARQPCAWSERKPVRHLRTVREIRCHCLDKLDEESGLPQHLRIGRVAWRFNTDSGGGSSTSVYGNRSRVRLRRSSRDSRVPRPPNAAHACIRVSSRSKDCCYQRYALCQLGAWLEFPTGLTRS